MRDRFLQYLQTEYIDQLCRKLQWEEVEENEVEEENETRKTDEERFESSLEPLRITIQQPPLSMLFIIFFPINPLMPGGNKKVIHT